MTHYAVARKEKKRLFLEQISFLILSHFFLFELLFYLLDSGFAMVVPGDAAPAFHAHSREGAKCLASHQGQHPEVQARGVPLQKLTIHSSCEFLVILGVLMRKPRLPCILPGSGMWVGTTGRTHFLSARRTHSTVHRVALSRDGHSPRGRKPRAQTATRDIMDLCKVQNFERGARREEGPRAQHRGGRDQAHV